MAADALLEGDESNGAAFSLRFMESVVLSADRGE